jgi:thiamine biosynthesis lipoprotein
MGTVVNITLVGEDTTRMKSIVRACLDRMTELETILSRFQLESQLSQLNRDGFLENAAAPLLEVVCESQRYSQLSDGAFDITVKPLLDLYQQSKSQESELPSEMQVQNTLDKVGYKKIQISGRDVTFLQKSMEITLDGIAKGYIVDQGVAVLQQNDFKNILIEAGGDLMALGEKSPGSPWRIGIQSPRQPTLKFLMAIPIQTQAVATSGDYHQTFSDDYRHHHIVDPRTGFSVPELASASVIAPTVMQADILATTAMTMKLGAVINLIENLEVCDALLITKDLEIIRTRRLALISSADLG